MASLKEAVTVVRRNYNLKGASNEVLRVELMNKKGTATLLGVYYRPPDSQREIEEQICANSRRGIKIMSVIILGDFNFPNINWDCHQVQG